MKKRGVEAVRIEDLASLPKGTVIIRSHGVSREIFNFVKRSGHRVVDATCPFVKKIHAIVSVQSGKGKTVVIIGNPEHPEVMGIRGWGDENTYAVENIEQFINLKLKKDTKYDNELLKYLKIYSKNLIILESDEENDNGILELLIYSQLFIYEISKLLKKDLSNPDYSEDSMKIYRYNKEII